MNRIYPILKILFLLGVLGMAAFGQQPAGSPKTPDLEQLASQVREEAERQLPVWRDIFNALGMDQAYDPEKIAGVCLRGGRSSLECQLNAVTGIVAFQTIFGDDIVDNGAEKLKSLLGKFAECGRSGSCARFEKELISRTQSSAAPTGPPGGEFDPEKVYSMCLSQQDPKNPCTKQFCFNAAVMSGSFLLLFSTGNDSPDTPRTPEQQEQDARTRRLIEKLNEFTRRVGQTAADEKCKNGLPSMPSPPEKPNN
ncbi:MAG: hypothetical protein K1X36_06645 [Pyrinomonadaceae bacterium]|nr:hypothetical protein [Pyrinomonadaceae bacterium]